MTATVLVAAVSCAVMPDEVTADSGLKRIVVTVPESSFSTSKV